jgi:hypothetical protein
MFNYTSDGKMKFNGCSAVSKSENFLSKYQRGDRVWLYYKAKKGILESVVIKELRILGGSFSYNKVVSIYVDTYNFLYNEEELIPLNLALELKNNYCLSKSIFKYNSNIKIKLHSCNGYDPQPPITTKFQIGEIAYLRNKAKQGMMESIFIKKLKPLNSIVCQNIYAIYLDNNNFYYNEEELVKEDEAKNLIKEFVINKINNLSKSKISCTLNKNSVRNCKF